MRAHQRIDFLPIALIWLTSLVLDAFEQNRKEIEGGGFRLGFMVKYLLLFP